MKKLLYFTGVFISIAMWMGSCNDNENFSAPHVLTDSEIDEMHRQDSLDSIKRTMVNADLILDYAVTLNEGECYEGKEVEVEWAKAAEIFGISVDQLWAAIDNDEASPLFIMGSTHADYSGGNTANGKLGYWCDKSGDVCSWGSSAAVFEEWYSDADNPNAFLVGQMPEALAAGDVVTIMPGVKYQDKRVIFRMTFTIKAIEDTESRPAGNPETIEANVSMEKDYSDDYASVEFDVKEILRQAFKMTTKEICDAISAGDVKAYVGEVSEEEPNYTADAPGYWISSEGKVTTWGADSYIWLSLGNKAADALLYLYGGNHPEYGRDGADINFKFIVTCTNGGQAIFNVNYKIKAFSYTDPETKPGTTPANIEKDIALTKTWTDDYADTSTDVKKDVCDAFNMTTYELFNALNAGTLKVYVNEVTEAAPEYTGSGAGEYWVNGDGAAVVYAEGYLYTGLYIDYKECSITIGMGNHPDNCPKTFSVKYKLIVTDGATTATFNVTSSISE